MSEAQVNVNDPSPSTLHVWRTLKLSSDPLRPAELSDRTGYSLKTIRVATSTLEDAGVVESVYPDHGDLRKRAFRVSRPPPETDNSHG